MSTLHNPTKEQVVAFCTAMQEQLLAAIDRGADIELGNKMATKELSTPEYAPAVVDAIYVGATFRAKFRERGF